MAGVKRKRSSTVSFHRPKKAKYSKKSYKKRSYKKKRMPKGRRSYRRRSDASGGLFRAAASRQRLGQREGRWAQYLASADAALKGRIARRDKSVREGFSSRAWGAGRYGLGKMLRHGAHSLSKYEKKHHTLGRLAMGAVKNYTGLGMYTGNGSYDGDDDVEANSLVNNGGLVGVPSFASSGDETGAVTIQHREYVSELFGPTNSFQNEQFPLNPGLEKTFPWLSQIAANYEEYELVQCMFTFRSTTSDHGGTTTSGQVGTVIMCTQYNPSKEKFDSKQMMMGYDAAGSGKCTSDQVHGVECDNAKLSGTDEKYVRTAAVLDDLKNYDHGNFEVAISNSPPEFANEALGELWVSYTVVLRKPKLFTGRGFAISQDEFVQTDPGVHYPLSGTNHEDTLLKGMTNSIGCKLIGYGMAVPTTGLTSSGTGGVPIDYTTGAGNVMTLATEETGVLFPAGAAGYYEITFRYNGSGMVHNNYAAEWTCYGNVSMVQDILVGGTGGSSFYVHQDRTEAVGASDHLVLTYHVRVKEAVNGLNNVFKFKCGVSTGPIVRDSCTLTIKEYNTSGSYRHHNRGTNDAPIMVNSAGTIVNPVDA